MSSTLYYEIVRPEEEKYLSDDLKRILKEKFDICPGDRFRLHETHINYFEGLKDAGVDGAEIIHNHLKEGDHIDIYIG